MTRWIERWKCRVCAHAKEMGTIRTTKLNLDFSERLERAKHSRCTVCGFKA